MAPTVRASVFMSNSVEHYTYESLHSASDALLPHQLARQGYDMKYALTLISLLLAVVASAAFSQDYPAKPIRIIVSYAPGGGTDVIARVLAKKLNEALGQAVIVENRPGAGGNIGTEALAKAAADGYTLSLVPSSHAIAPLFYAKLPFDVFKDFTFITLVASGPNIVVVNPLVPATSVADLVALAQQKPGELTFASA